MDGFLEALRIQRWDDHRYYHHSRINQTLHLVSAISFLGAYVLVFTESGRTAALMAGERTSTPVYAFSPHWRTLQRLSLVWGVCGMKVSHFRTSREMTLDGERQLLERRLLRKGDRLIVVRGSIRESGLTNTMHIRTLGGRG